MKKHLLAAAAVLTCILATISVTSAQTATFSYDDAVGVPNAGTYAPGSSFTFSINLTFAPGGTVTNLDGFSYWFEQQNPSAPFFFTITSRDVSGSFFTELQSPGLTPQPLTPSNVKDLGAIESNGLGFGPGSYFVAKITISIDPSATPGIYQIENTTTGGKTSVIFDDQGHGAVIPQAIYTITVAPVPEPATLTLLAGGLAMSALLARRRRNSN
jgi:PEP-CTERM motif